MRAAWYSKNGKARDVLTVGELPTPQPSSGEVRVKLATSGVNPSDVKSRTGRAPASERIVPHSDGAGVIDAVGATVRRRRASASVGHYAAQIATLNGARVIGTVGSTEKSEHAKAGGAEATIDYKTESVAKRVEALTGGRGVDAIVDLDFSTTVALLSTGTLRAHGTLVSYGSNAYTDLAVPFRTLLWNSFNLRCFLVYELGAHDRRAAIDGLGTLLARGALLHTIGARFALDDIAAAHEAVESGRHIGMSST